MFFPGHEIPVEVLADSAGTLALEGDGVALVGENADAVTVELQEATSDVHVGILKDDPEDWARDNSLTQSDFSSGDSGGMATVALGVPVAWYLTDSGYTPTVGDLVEVGDGGDIEAYSGPTTSSVGTLTNTLGIDGSGNLENDGGSDIDVNLGIDAFPDGIVLSSIARQWGVGDRTAVIKGAY